MADSNRPRPRPKPRPKLASAASRDTAQPSSRAPSSKRSSSKPVEIQDEDQLFIRNRGRSTKTWAKLDEITKVAENKVITVESDSDDSQASPRARKQKRKAPSPTTSNIKNLERLLSVELSSDSDGSDDVKFLGSSTTPRPAKKTTARKRQRTRSRSITPPPEVPQQRLQQARALVQKALNIAPRAPSPVLIESDDEDDTVFTNPELARIAQSAARRARSHLPASSPQPEATEAETVELSVKWKPHPLNESWKEDVWVFKMNRDDNFRDLFEATAEEASILSENLIMTYRGKRIFASITPASLRIWSKDELVACDKGTYEYIRKNPMGSSHLSFDPESTPAPEEPSDNEEPATSQDTENVSDADGDTFKLVIRSSITKDITLTVRPTTKCAAIVKAFLKKAGVEAQYPEVFGDSKKTPKKGGRGQKAANKDPRLCVDGDKMENDTEISEADLEDGDMVEIVGL